MNIVVLGAGGMFGSMAAAVLGRTFSVTALGRDGLAVEDGADGLAAALAGKPPGLVVNAIGILAGAVNGATPSALRTAIRVNAEFPHLLAEVATAAGWRVAHVSSDAVFARNCGLVDEGAPTAPEDAYGLTKALGEPRCDGALSVRCSVIGPRPGPRQHGLWEWLAGQPPGATIPGFVDQLWSGCTTWQLAHLCARLADPAFFGRVRAHGPVLHFAPNPVVSKFELLRHLAEVLRPDVTVVPQSGGLPICRLLASRVPLGEVPPPPAWPDIIATTRDMLQE